MTQNTQADEARKGLVDSIKGKAKEVVGAVTNNDSLTVAGQLEQSQASLRREANHEDAIANAQEERAEAQATDARLDAAEERMDLENKAVSLTNSIEAEEGAQKRTIAQAARRDAARDQVRAQMEADIEVAQAESKEREQANSADTELNEARGAHQEAVQESNEARAEASRLREHADDLAVDTDPANNN